MSASGTKRTLAGALHMSAFGVKRTYRFALHMSAFDPSGHSGTAFSRLALGPTRSDLRKSTSCSTRPSALTATVQSTKLVELTRENNRTHCYGRCACTCVDAGQRGV